MRVMMQRRASITTVWQLVALMGAIGIPAHAAATEANDLCLPTANPCRVTRNVDVDDMSVIDVGTRELRIDAGGRLAVDAGQMTLRAGRITVSNNGELRARGPASDVGLSLIHI